MDLTESKLTDKGIGELAKLFLKEIHLGNSQFSAQVLAAAYKKSFVGFEQVYLGSVYFVFLINK